MQGLCQLLRKNSPDIVVVVTDDSLREMAASEQQLRLLLFGYGYHMFQISWDGLIFSADSDDALIAQFDCFVYWKDYISRVFTYTSSEYAPCLKSVGLSGL